MLKQEQIDELEVFLNQIVAYANNYKSNETIDKHYKNAAEEITSLKVVIPEELRIEESENIPLGKMLKLYAPYEKHTELPTLDGMLDSHEPKQDNRNQIVIRAIDAYIGEELNKSPENLTSLEQLHSSLINIIGDFNAIRNTLNRLYTYGFTNKSANENQEWRQINVEVQILMLEGSIQRLKNEMASVQNNASAIHDINELPKFEEIMDTLKNISKEISERVPDEENQLIYNKIASPLQAHAFQNDQHHNPQSLNNVNSSKNKTFLENIKKLIIKKQDERRTIKAEKAASTSEIRAIHEKLTDIRKQLNQRQTSLSDLDAISKQIQTNANELNKIKKEIQKFQSTPLDHYLLSAEYKIDQRNKQLNKLRSKLQSKPRSESPSKESQKHHTSTFTPQKILQSIRRKITPQKEKLDTSKKRNNSPSK